MSMLRSRIITTVIDLVTRRTHYTFARNAVIANNNIK